MTRFNVTFCFDYRQPETFKKLLAIPFKKRYDEWNRNGFQTSKNDRQVCTNNNTVSTVIAHRNRYLHSLSISFVVNGANDENVSSSTTTKDEDTDLQMTEQAPAKNGVNGIGKDAAKKRTSFIPVKPNRTSELRRASIYRSKSVSDVLQPLQFITPKKPIPSTTMVKSVNAIIRSECRHNATSQKLARKSLGAAASTNFPKMIDNLNLFNVVTDEMKMVGPSAYISNKFGQTNSPKRTPKKLLQKPKRLSLRSEVRTFFFWWRK